MGTVNWQDNVKFTQNAEAKVTGVGGLDWRSFLDALGRVEGNNSYDTVNGQGYVGMYQFAPSSDRYSIFKTLDFFNNVGAMLNITSDVGYL